MRPGPVSALRVLLIASHPLLVVPWLRSKSNKNNDLSFKNRIKEHNLNKTVIKYCKIKVNPNIKTKYGFKSMQVKEKKITYTLACTKFF